jgi:hypothetical protein
MPMAAAVYFFMCTYRWHYQRVGRPTRRPNLATSGALVAIAPLLLSIRLEWSPPSPTSHLMRGIFAAVAVAVVDVDVDVEKCMSILCSLFYSTA